MTERRRAEEEEECLRTNTGVRHKQGLAERRVVFSPRPQGRVTEVVFSGALEKNANKAKPSKWTITLRLVLLVSGAHLPPRPLPHWVPDGSVTV